MQNLSGTAIYLSFLANNLKVQSERSRDEERMREARSVFEELAAVITATDPLSRNLPPLNRTLAELSLEIGEPAEARCPSALVLTTCGWL